MRQKANLPYYFAAAIIVAVLFSLFHIFPLTGDDWFREGLGAGLHSVRDLFHAVVLKWNTSNGRILGNVLAYTAGSRPFVRDVLRTGILMAIVVLLSRITRNRTASGLLLCTALTLCLPRTLFREVYPWAAGYFNYVPPVALVLLAMCLLPDLWEGKPVRGSAGRSIALFAVAFSTQLFVENVTLYVICSAVVLNVYHCVRFRKVSAGLLCYLIGAIAGAALLFASPSYVDIFLHGKGYQLGAGSGVRGLLASARRNCAVVFHSLLADCPVLYLGITVLLAAHLLRASKPTAGDKITIGLLALCAAALLLGTSPARITVGICLLWFLLAALGIFRLRKALGYKALHFLLSALCAALPLLFVNPIGPRCLYISYVFLLVVALELLAGLKLNGKIVLPLSAALCVAVVAVGFSIYYPLHLVDVQQRDAIEAAMAQGAQSVTVQAYPSDRWLWEPDTPKMQYAYYYQAPNDFTISFVPAETSR